jgi:integral membrane protein
MITAFRIIAFLEGLSYILLLFIAVPVKYILEDESYVKLLGMPHGLLFVAYIAMAFMVRAEQKWPKFIFAKILVAALIPFATFYIDFKYLKPITK